MTTAYPRILVALLFVVLVFQFPIGCSRFDDSSSNLGNIDDLPNVDDEAHPNPCEGDIIYERTYSRNKGKPVVDSDEFITPYNGTFCVHVTNGEQNPPHGKRVSSAVIEIDSSMVFGPEDFDQNVSEVFEVLQLDEGIHALDVELRSKPGSFINVAIAGLPGDKEGPSIYLSQPIVLRESDAGIYRHGEATEHGVVPYVRVVGNASDPSGISSITVSSSSGHTSVLDSADDFSQEIPLTAEGKGPNIITLITVSAIDSVGNESSLRIMALVPVDVVFGRINITFKANAANEQIAQILSNLNGHVLYRYNDRSVILSIDDSLDPVQVVKQLNNNPVVLYSTYSGAPIEHSPIPIPSEIDTYVWYLHNDGSAFLTPQYPQYPHIQCTPNVRCYPDNPIPCASATDCAPYPGLFCIGGVCSCPIDFTCRGPIGQETCRCPGQMQCSACETQGGSQINCCLCGTDSDCYPNGEFGVECATTSAPDVFRYGTCGYRAMNGADIGWSEPSAWGDIAWIEQNSEEVVIAHVDGQGSLWMDNVLFGSRMWTNSKECCGLDECTDTLASGLTRCYPGEVLPDYNNMGCNSDGDCPLGMPCIKIHSVCAVGVRETSPGELVSIRGERCTSHQDCEDCPFTGCEGFGWCTSPLVNDAVGDIGLCTDGCPGICGVDDDGDGYTDMNDPEVKNLLSILCPLPWDPLSGNNLDDDGDGCTDDCCILGIEPSCSSSDACYPGEQLLVNWDDDENGIIDDAHGASFGLMTIIGQPFSTTMFSVFRGQHARSCAGKIVANEIDLAPLVHWRPAGKYTGVHPAAKLVTMGMIGSFDLNPAIYDYLSKLGVVDIVSQACISGERKHPSHQEQPNSDEEYFEIVERRKREFEDSIDPNTLYFLSAGNRNIDLDTSWDPGIEGDNAETLFPTHVESPYLVVVSATDARDRFVERFLGDKIKGSAYGFGTVDFAAPGGLQHTTKGLSSGNYNHDNSWGTSYSAPISAGVGGLILSKYPSVFRDRALLLYNRMVETLATSQNHLETDDSLSTLIGKMSHPGRVDVAFALDDSVPLPEVPPFRNESWRLMKKRSLPVTDAEFFHRRSDGTIPTFLIEVYENAPAVPEHPRLFELNWNTGMLEDVTFGNDGVPGGTGGDADRLPNIAGNYSKVKHADLNGDGCNDLVLAGSYGIDAAGNKIGMKNKLLFQETPFGSCSGRFRDVSDEDVDVPPLTKRFPRQETITVDIEIGDFSGDGINDIFFTDRDVFPPGSTSPPQGFLYGQLLVNRTNLVGSFTDESHKVRKEAPMPGLHEDPPISSVSCDIDHDGDIDLIQGVWVTYPDQNPTPTRVFINDGNGNLLDNFDDYGIGILDGDAVDIECVDIASREDSKDEFPEIFMAITPDTPRGTHTDRNMYYFNKLASLGHFVRRWNPLRFDIESWTNVVRVCNLVNDDPGGTGENDYPEIFIGNGWRGYSSSNVVPERNRLLDHNSTTGDLEDKATELGFDFDFIKDVTTDIECIDITGDGLDDIVYIANYGTRSWLYVRVIP